MKVRYTIPVRGTLRLAGTGHIAFPGFEFRLIRSEGSDYVDTLQIDVLNIPKDEWPTIIPVEQDPNATIKTFPFAVNPNVLRFSTYLPQVLNLESLLSLFGVEHFDTVKHREEWLAEPDDEQVGLMQGFRRTQGEREMATDPVSDHTFARLIGASKGSETETGGLAHFRVSNTFFHAERYIDAIRYAYLCVEYLFARGHHKKKQTLDAFAASADLTAAVERVLRYNVIQSTLKRLQKRYNELATPTPATLLEWAFDLRGSIQHGNPMSPSRWHPSRQEDLRDESTVLMNVAHEVCWDIAEKRLQDV